MNVKAQKMREVLTKFHFQADSLYNLFDVETLNELVMASKTLISVLECEKMVLTSVQVKAILMDDLNVVNNNLIVIESTIRLKGLKFDGFYLN